MSAARIAPPADTAAQFLIDAVCSKADPESIEPRFLALLPVAVWVDRTSFRMRWCGHMGFTILEESYQSQREAAGLKRRQVGIRWVCTECGHLIE